MAYFLVDGDVTPTFLVPVGGTGSNASGAATVYIDVLHSPTLIFPAISGLAGGALNQKVTVTNLSPRSNPTFQPAASDTFSNNGSGVSVVGPSGAGYVRIFEPASSGITPGSTPTWSLVQG